MTKNIYIVEGLPGVGKSYFCEILQQEIRDKTGNKKIFFFEERDMDHPFHHSKNDIANDIWSIDYRFNAAGGAGSGSKKPIVLRNVIPSSTPDVLTVEED